MKKSLLEILEEETKAVVDERFYADSLKDFENHMQGIGFDAEACQRICEGYEEKRKEAEKRVLAARMELREYLSEIEKLGNL